MKRVVVAGLGNELMTDDGAGVHAARLLLGKEPPGVEVVDVGTAFVRSLGALEGASAIVAMDALDAGGPPGALYAMDGRDASRPSGAGLHGMGLMGALDILGGGCPDVLVLGIQPQSLEIGTALTPRVAEAVPRLAEMAALAAERISNGEELSAVLAALAQT